MKNIRPFFFVSPPLVRWLFRLWLALVPLAGFAQTFTKLNFLTTPVRSTAVAVADVNGDNLKDILTVNDVSGSFTVMLKQASGTWTSTDYPLTGRGVYSDLAVTDVNADGKPDLLLANSDTNIMGVLLGNGNGTFQKLQTYNTGKASNRLAIADVNADGKPDVIVGNAFAFSSGLGYYGESAVGVLLGNGDGTFQAVQAFATTLPSVGTTIGSAVAVADVNADGRPDILVTVGGTNFNTTPSTYVTMVGVLLGNGNGTFQAVRHYAPGGGARRLAVADVNADGWPDLLAANTTTNTAGVLLGNGNGTFQAVRLYATGARPTALAVADMDFDGLPDLVTANSTTTTVGILRGNGDGSFQATEPFTVDDGSTTYQPYSLAVSDMNADGKPDIVTPLFDGPTATVLINTSPLPPQVTTAVPILGAGSSVTLGGNVTTAGDAAVTERGVVYVAGYGLPTAADTKLVIGSGTGSFAQAVSLNPYTNYTVRAYATSSVATSYGPPRTVSTTLTYAPAVVSGFTADVIAEGTNQAVSNVTSDDVDGVGYVLMQIGFSTGTSTATQGLPASGYLPAAVGAAQPTPSVPYQLASASAKNTLRQTSGSASATLTLAAPTKAADLYLLVTSGSGPVSFTATVTYSDGLTAAAVARTTPDWYNQTPYVRQGLGRAQRGNGTVDNDTNNPRLYQVALSNLDVTRRVQAVTITHTGSGGVLQIMGVTLAAVETQINALSLGAQAPGGSLTIYGTNLTGAMLVSFANGMTATPTSIDPAGIALTVTVPTGAGTGDVQVTTAYGISNGLPLTVKNFLATAATGYTNDVVADGIGATAQRTSNTFDTQYVLMMQGYDNAAGSTATVGLPATGTLTSVTTAGLSFQLGPYTGNNTLRLLANGSTGTLTLAAQPRATGLRVLTASGYGPADFAAVVNFVDGTSQTFNGLSSPDWYALGTPATTGLGRADRSTNAIDNSAANPRLSELTLTLSAANALRQVANVQFTKTTGTGQLNLLAISVEQAPAPTLTSLSPMGGPVGTSVTLTGTGFTSGSTVRFGGTAATSVTFTSATSLTATVPTGAGVGNVTVTTPDGISNGLPFEVQMVVTARNPARNAQATPRITTLNVTFDQPVAPGTATNLRVFSQQRGGQLVRGGNTTASDNTVSCNPLFPVRGLVAGETAFVTVPSTVTSTAGYTAQREVYQVTGGAPRGTNLLTSAYTLSNQTPRDAAVGDLNGDLRLDLLVQSGTDLTPYFNNGTGTAFTAGTAFGAAASDSPLRVILADVDGDGDLDAVQSRIPVRVCKNDGTGQFGPASSYGFGIAAGGGYGRAVGVGDIDADGDLDVLSVAQNSPLGTPNFELYVLLNDGTGAYTPATSIPLGSTDDVPALVVGDYNNDGKLDVAFCTYNSGTVKVLLGNGSGGFALAPGSPFISAAKANAIGAADFNNDGSLDLVVGTNTSPGQLVLLLNNGSAEFAPATGSPFTAGNQIQSLSVGDVNGDSNADVLLANYGTAALGAVSSHLGTGTGSLGTATDFTATADNGRVTTGDFNADGALDAVSIDQPGTTLNVLLNQPSSVPAPTLTLVNPASGPVGTSVTLTGTNFLASSTVSFGGINATSVTFNSATSLTTVVPTGTTSGNVTVTTTGGTTSGLAFTVTTASTPTLTMLNPTSGPVGTSVALTGTNFTAGSTVSFNGTAATVTLNSATSLTAVVPTGASTGSVTVTTPDGTSNALSFTVTVPAVAPTVTTAAATSLTATSATLGGDVTADGGATITERGVVYVTGSGTPTTADPKITATGTTGSFTASATGLTAGTTYTVRAYAINSAGTSYGSSQSFSTSAATPTLTSLSPTSGPVGTSVTLTGTNFTAGSTVSFNGTAATSVTFNSATSLTALVPSGATSGNVTVTTTDGTTSGLAFTVTTPVSAPTLTMLNPTSGPVGTSVTLTGTNFTAGSTVSFNGTAATSVTFNSATSLTALVPSGATSGNVTVTTTDGTTSGISFTVTAPDLTISTGSTGSPVSIIAGTYHDITITSNGYATLSGAVVVTGAFVVSGGLNTNCQALTGTGSFTLAAGGTLGICDAAGISSTGNTGAVQTSGTRSFSTDASYLYNGTTVQGTGTGLPARVRNLSTTNGQPLTLSAATSVAQALTVAGSGNLVLNGQALTLLSNATGTALAVNSGTGVVTGGTATVQRSIDGSQNAGSGYRHYAAPVSGSTVADLTTAGFAPEVSRAALYNASATPGTTTPFPTVFGYDQSRLTLTNNFAAFDKGFFVPAGLSAPLTPGQGYAVQIGAAQLVDFVGTLGTGDQTVSLSRNAGTTAADAGWALVGNPYPAPLDWSQVAAADRSGLDAAVYVVQSSGPYTGSYRAYVNGQSSTGTNNPLLATAQGFWVRVRQGQPTGSLTFRDAQRVTDYATAQTTRFQRPTADTRPALRLGLTGAGAGADAWVAYAQAGATAAFDSEFDAAKLANSTGLNLSSASGAERLAIDGRPAFTPATVLPLAVGVPAAGAYTLEAAIIANLPGGLTAYLLDAQTGTSTALAAGTRYAFAVSAAQAAAVGQGRFSVVFRVGGALATTPAQRAAAVGLYPNPAQTTATVVLPAGAGLTTADLMNALGQEVRRFALPTAETRLDLRGLATGVYVLRLSLDGQPVRKRLVIE